jgi:uncharacterized protein (TIGR02996 family)
VSDEAAFLAALKANLADDTARLVYADWLDEHNEPAKAEYLRLVVELTRQGPVVDAASPIAARLGALEGQLSQAWCGECGNRFDLLLCDYTDKFRAIKTLRSTLFIGLGALKELIETSLPAGWITSGCLTEVGAVATEFSGGGLRFVIQVSGGGHLTPRLFYPILEPWPLGLTNGIEEDLESLGDAVASVLGSAAGQTAVRTRAGNQRVVIQVPSSVHTLVRLRHALAARPNAIPDYRWYISVELAPGQS